MMTISFFGKSDIGKIRKANEDYYTHEQINDNEYVFIVADGMGGHKAGEVASKLGTLTFIDNFRLLRNNNTAIQAAMEQSLKKANKTILKRAVSDPEKRGMGTTFSAISIADMKANIIHVGDSRIYLVRNERIKRITKDHTFVEKMVEEGRISEDEARDHPQKNILYMSLGARESLTPEFIGDIPVKDGDIICMCSDGLNSMVPDKLIKEYVLSYTPQEAAEKLIKIANDNGGTDNITLQIIRIGSMEDKHKTEPIPVQEQPRKKDKTVYWVLGFLLILVVMWLVV